MSMHNPSFFLANADLLKGSLHLVIAPNHGVLAV